MRERKKAKEGNTYREKEVKRVQKYYHCTVNLSKPELEARREVIRRSVAKHREAKRTIANDDPTTSNDRLLVRVDFHRAKWKKTPAFKHAREKISSLEQRESQLVKANKRLMKHKKKNADNTPRSRTSSFCIVFYH